MKTAGRIGVQSRGWMGVKTSGWVDLKSRGHFSVKDDTWEEIFRPTFGQEVVYSEDGNVDLRPPEWDVGRERQKTVAAKPAQPRQASGEAGLGELITPEQLNLVYLGVELAERATEREAGQPETNGIPGEPDAATQSALPLQVQTSWQRMRSEVGSSTSVSLALRFDGERIQWEDPVLRELRARRNGAAPAGIAVMERAEPLAEKPSWTELIFDLDRIIPEHEGDNRCVAALVEAMAGRDYSRFGVYQQLREWQRRGWLMRATLAIIKRGDLMLFDSLSDGERSFLGRMALLHLLADQDDVLLILDEPETHFNDVWKRQVVDIIDDNLRNHANEVVISTHSSIALTDVFRSELIVLSQGRARLSPIETFGASPNEILVNVFGSEVQEPVDPLGQRAAEFLDMVLMVVSHPQQVSEVWAQLTAGMADTEIHLSASFSALRDYVRLLRHRYGDDSQLNETLLGTLRSIRQHAQRRFLKEDVTVIDSVTALEEKLGPGAYEFEFRRRLRALRQTNNASSD